MKKKNKLPYDFDLFFDCKTEEEVLSKIKYLEYEQERLKLLKEMWKEYKDGEIQNRKR